MTDENPKHDQLRDFFEGLEPSQLDALREAFGSVDDNDDVDDEAEWEKACQGEDDDDGSDDEDDETLAIFAKFQTLLGDLPPEKQQELADALASRASMMRDWLGDFDDGRNHVPNALMFGIASESDVGERAIVRYSAWDHIVELMLRIDAVTLDESEMLKERQDGIRDPKQCKAIAAKLRKWCGKYGAEDTVEFGPEELCDMEDFQGWQVLAADAETNDDMCQVQVGNVLKFAEFLDQCGGFRWR